MTPPRQRLSKAGSRWAAARDPLRERAAPYLGIDPRALGVFRVALALLLLADLLVYRLPGVVPFYTDAGVLPRSTLAEAYPLLDDVSIHALSGSARVQTGLIAVAALAAVCLLVGYRTRAATGVSVVLLASLYARNPYAINGGNTILVVFLFVSLFLPLDARWSLGGSRGSGVVERRACSVGTAVTLLTLVSIYAANAVSKYRSDAWVSGVAVPRIFQLGEFTVGLGPLVADHAAVLAAVNWLWIALLSASVLLVAATGRLRTGVALAFVAAHLGMAATMRLAVFPFVMVSVLLLFLPPRVWDHVETAGSELPVPGRSTGHTARSDGGRAGGGSGDGGRGDGGTDGPGKAAGSAFPVEPRIRRGLRAGAALLLVGFFLALVWWQAAGVGLVDLPASEPAGELSEASWSFFAPNPPDASGWYVVRGTLESGDAIDVRDGGAVAFDRPPDAAATYPTTLWHQFGFRMKDAGESRYRPVASYVCERSDRDLSSVTVFHVEQPVDPDGPVGEPRVEEQIHAAC
ncbi:MULTISPECIES: HTTM domain-containing protein [Halorubrum]|uniref:HTTM domain protein n=1 Tax=Halorubrum hochstenium ATCC 700873 TaxID=1227481 RepID=M0FPK9_9EURY|nr:MULTISPECIES: HTTM domain-containing protein [Halorubrum]ELZ61223.1 HTTM domain protein [Halorubrum hochstenium ATCC 700873]